MTKAEINKLDKRIREVSLERTDCCEFCGKRPKKLDAHHYIGRRNRACRWIPMNIFMLCTGCHFKAHENPIWSRDKTRLTRGTGWESRMRKIAQHINKHDYDTNLELMTMSLDRLLKFYESPLDSVVACQVKI